VIAANSERAAVMREHYRLPVMPTVVGNVPPKSASVFDGDDVLDRFPSLRKAAPGDVHVVYMGDIDFDRGLGVFVESAAWLPPKFKLVFVGGGPHLGRVEELARADPGRFVAVGQVAHAHVHDVIRCADIGYVTYKMVGLNNLLCAPNKIYEYANAGLPILSTCQHTVRRIFSEHRIGRLVGCDALVTPKEIATALQELAGNLADYRRELEPFLSHYSWQAESSRLAGAVDALGLPGMRNRVIPDA
jgi:glycosyltransferase involved in cell wall biosynthesis